MASVRSDLVSVDFFSLTGSLVIEAQSRNIKLLWAAGSLDNGLTCLGVMRVGRGVMRVGRGVMRVGRGVMRVGRCVMGVGRGVRRVGRCVNQASPDSLHGYFLGWSRYRTSNHGKADFGSQVLQHVF